MSDPTDEQVADLAAALDVFSRRFKLTDVGAGRALAEIDKHILHYVEAHPDCGPTDVARSFGVAMTTISSATDRLAKRGLLERLRPSDDRRAVALRLTADGTSYTADHKRAYMVMFRAMLAPLSPAERDAFVAMMTKIASYES
ncbi:MarR family winged helix-turn-helix transcriptional regulator [Frigidibacter sp.]|uniref:MarR family winged helix-turn-helix transcriptional regulator n=1 Tax=Frigidibacter sp. TaxID=2586418 RepID=UPI0027337C61|nr:MarR family winged helix-turn-helix transcriptional regulator [Frigidibacter sp.]MDP3339250.1 MarR family winged helix-turn-helix transcriptional regulator [Frigidibacter sp.]